MQHCDKNSQDEIELQAQLVHVNAEIKHCDYEYTNKASWDDDYVSYRKAIWELTVLSVPSGVALIIEYSIFFLNIVFIGLLKDSVLMSGWGLGNFTINIVVYSISMGVWGALDTLITQAYGRKELKLWGVYLNACRLIIILVFVPQTLIIVYSEQLFLLIGQPPESAAVAWEYLVMCLPGLFFNMQFECTRRYLLAIGIRTPILYVLVAAIAVHLTSLIICVLIEDMGIFGVGLSTSITYTINWFLISLYTYFQREEVFQAKWSLFNVQILWSMPMFLKYGVPSCFMLLIEWWAEEIIGIFAGWLGVAELATFTIISNIFLICVEIPYALSLTSSWYVGNNLGSNSPNKAKTYAYSTVILGFINSAASWLFFLIFYQNILAIYTNDENDIDLFNSVVPLIVVGIFTWMIHQAVSGVIRGAGYQSVGMTCFAVSYWGVSLPLAYILVFVYDMKFVGLYVAIPIGSSLLLTSFIVIVCKAPWKTLAQEASILELQSEDKPF